MNILKIVTVPIYFYEMTMNDRTEHLRRERLERYNKYTFEFGKGRAIVAFEVDKGHENGNEIHVLCDNRLIYIFNKSSKKFITVLYARPAQISRYYKAVGKYLEVNKYHEYREGWNNI